MATTANQPGPEQGKFRCALATIWAFLQAMESTSFDHTLDRIERLEREVAQLKEDLRRSYGSAADDAFSGNAPFDA
ncbi:hypothetical protein [Roseateles sp.]|uniref:hypothetical protein n=1 Tax=Roseateles sp. TaxID=1971397 RepID=UPI003BACCD12